MPVNKYRGTLNFVADGKQQQADVSITAISLGADAGGGWECTFSVQYAGQTHTAAFTLMGNIVRNAQFSGALQSALTSMPKPLSDITVKNARFSPKLVS